MESISKRATNVLETSPSTDTLYCHPVPFGHVPYSPGLPGLMGPLLNFPTEWWYYAGWAHGDSKNFTIMMQVIRHGNATAVVYGIGTTPKQFFSHSSYKLDWITPAPPTPIFWSLDAETTNMKMTCDLKSGILGLSDAEYALQMTDTDNQVTASFQLKDALGTVLEVAGAFPGDKNTYESAMPSLTIKSGTITMGKVTTTLEGGKLWLDRQTITSKLPPSIMVASPFTYAGRLSSSLYIGNWLAAIMEDGTVYMLAFFWPKKEKDQWIVGTEVGWGPVSKVGFQYPPLTKWDKKAPIVGVKVLNNKVDNKEFDLNILNPQTPEKSPHWTSRATNQTYCSAWKLKLLGKEYDVHAMVPGSEVNLPLVAAFFEGAATICDSKGVQHGYCFIEQMGYTTQ